MESHTTRLPNHSYLRSLNPILAGPFSNDPRPPDKTFKPKIKRDCVPLPLCLTRRLDGFRSGAAAVRFLDGEMEAHVSPTAEIKQQRQRSEEPDMPPRRRAINRIPDQHSGRGVSDHHSERRVSDHHSERGVSDHHSERGVSDHHSERGVSEKKHSRLNTRADYPVKFPPIELPRNNSNPAKCLHDGTLESSQSQNLFSRNLGLELQQQDQASFQDYSEQFLIQFPILPMFDPPTNGSAYEPSTLSTLPEGRLGSIRIKKSGNAQLVLNNGMLFDVTEGSTIAALHEVAAIIKSSLRVQEVLFLGSVKKKLICIPVVKCLIKDHSSE